MRRRMVALQRALEGSASDHRSSNLGLPSIVILHQVVGFVGMSLAAPDPPGDNTQTGKDDSATDTDNDTNDGVAGLLRHTTPGLLAVLIVGKTGRWGRGGEGFSRHGRGNSLFVGSSNDLGDGLNDGLDRRAGLGVLAVVLG